MRNVGLTNIAAAYLATLVVFVAIDFVWLSIMADRLYRPVLTDMLAENFRLAPAVAFYLIYSAGLTFLAVMPGLHRRSPLKAALNGGGLGFTAYATYDLTNQATLKSWSMALTLADLAWGTLLSATAAFLGCMIAVRRSGPKTTGKE